MKALRTEKRRDLGNAILYNEWCIDKDKSGGRCVVRLERLESLRAEPSFHWVYADMTSVCAC